MGHFCGAVPLMRVLMHACVLACVHAQCVLLLGMRTRRRVAGAVCKWRNLTMLGRACVCVCVCAQARGRRVPQVA